MELNLKIDGKRQSFKDFLKMSHSVYEIIYPDLVNKFTTESIRTNSPIITQNSEAFKTVVNIEVDITRYVKCLKTYRCQNY